MNPLARTRHLAGKELAGLRRRKKFPPNADYLPPRIRVAPKKSDFARTSSLASVLPMTLYWGMERNVDLDGCRPPGIPHLLGRFEWVVGFEYGWANTDKFPESVLCEPTYLRELLKYLKRRWPKSPTAKSFLAVAVGPDYLLSWQRQSVIRQLRTYFSHIYCEAKDVELDGIEVMPMGFTEHYTRANADSVLELAQNLERHPKGSTDSLSVLAAWGAWWPGLDGLIGDRARARAFAEASSLVSVQQLTSDAYFSALTNFDFMICPLGNGVQAPKMVEAILMGCIPIVTWHPTFAELQSRGMPMLMVDHWDSVSDELLRDVYPGLFAQVWSFRSSLLDLDSWWAFSFPCQAP